MHELTQRQEVQLLLNNEVVVVSSRNKDLHGRTGVVKAIMADDRTLDVELANGKRAFLDVTFVREVRERTQFAKTEQSLGPIANSVVKATL